MKILVILGSLRKKNTYEVTKKIEKYCNVDNMEFEYLSIKDLDFQLCRGCHICITYGEEKCPLKDDRDMIISKIESADGVVLACPNYVMNVNWLMKNYIDRFAYTMHRPKFFDQKFMILVTSGSSVGSKNALKSLSVMASGGRISSKLRVFYTPGMSQKKIEFQEKKIEKQAQKFFKSLSKSKEHKPSISYLIWFSVFKALSYENNEQLKADNRFYANKNYFIDMKLNGIQRGIVRTSTSFFRILAKKELI